MSKKESGRTTKTCQTIGCGNTYPAGKGASSAVSCPRCYQFARRHDGKLPDLSQPKPEPMEPHTVRVPRGFAARLKVITTMAPAEFLREAGMAWLTKMETAVARKADR